MVPFVLTKDCVRKSALPFLKPTEPPLAETGCMETDFQSNLGSKSTRQDTYRQE